MSTSKKEKHIMRNGRLLLAVALAMAGMMMFTGAGEARAVTLYYVDGVRDNVDPKYPVADETDFWADPNNWNTKMDGSGTYRVPVDGDFLQFGTNGLEYGNTDVDLAGVSVYLPNSGSQMNRLQYRIIDTVGGATLTLDTFTQNYSGPHSIAVPLIAQLVKTEYRVGTMTYYSTVDANSLELGRGNDYMYGDVTVTETAKIWRNPNGGGTNAYLMPNPDDPNTVPTLTTPVLDVSGVSGVAYMSGHVVTPEINIYDSGKYDAKIDTALGDANTIVSVTNTGILKLSVAQADLAQITAGNFGVLEGNFTGGIYGTNVMLNEDAILAITSGLADPSETDLGLAAGTFDAKIWKAVTADGTFEYGDDGDSVWKGTAFSSFTTGDLGGKRLVAPIGAGDLEVVWLPGAPTDKDPDGFYMDSLDQTGVANIALYTKFQAKNGTINQNPDANSVTTFNLTSHSTVTNTEMFVGNSGFIVRDDQTFNFSGPGRAYVDQDDVHGQLSFSGEAMYKFTGTPFLPTATDPNVKLTFGAGAMLSFGSGDVLDLEQLSPAQIVVDPDAMLGLETYGSNNRTVLSPQFNITDANNPNLVAIMKSHNVVTYSNNNNYAEMQGDGIQLGDGKYWLHYGNIHKGLLLRADASHPNAMIHGAGPGTTMGIGVVSGNGSEYLTVILPIDAHGATVLLNSTDTFTVANPGQNQRYTGVANRRLELAGPIHNAAEVVVLNSGVYVIDDAIDSGTLLGDLLPIRVAGTGTLQFQHSADGDGFVVSNLDKTQITIDQGGRVYVNGDMSVNTMVLNSTYSGGNDGLQINDSDDDLTITGKLSGNGAWGDSGQLIIADSAAVAPGNGVGELTGQNLTMAEGATYEWQIGNADGATPGTDWDVISAANITFDGAWTLKIPEANLAGTVTDTTSFIVASVTGNFTGFDAENVTFDLSGPGWTGGTLAIDGDDLVLSGLVSSLLGDADGDGDVDAADYIMVKRHFGGAPGAEGPGGDLDGNGIVDWADLQILQAAYDAGVGANTIPEPATLLMMLAAGLPALLKRRRS